MINYGKHCVNPLGKLNNFLEYIEQKLDESQQWLEYFKTSQLHIGSFMDRDEDYYFHSVAIEETQRLLNNIKASIDQKMPTEDIISFIYFTCVDISTDTIDMHRNMVYQILKHNFYADLYNQLCLRS